jgi:nucleoside-diphosphate-sugar epimerase
MRVLAVGATGVAGRELVPLLLRRGHEVVVMAPDDRPVTLPAGAERIHSGLLDEDAEALLGAALPGCAAVVNTATAMPRDFAKPGAWEANTRVREEGTRRLVRAVRAAGVRRLVQMSITMSYPDRGEDWLDESTPHDPNPQRRAIVMPVAALEAEVRALPASEVAWTILRAARFVGPGTIQDLHRQQLREGTLAVPGDGRSFVSMVHVGDFADAVVAALEQGPAAATLNVSDEPVRIGDYLDRLAAIDGSPRPRRDPGLAPDLPSHRVDSGAARRLLAWQPCRGIWPEHVMSNVD